MIEEILISLRKGRGLTQKELAKRLHFSFSVIQCAEKGKGISASLLSAYNRFFRKEIPDHIELTCKICEQSFVWHEELALICPECAKKAKPTGRGYQPKTNTHQYNPNPVTRDTVMIICMFHIEGQSVKQIARLLNRPEESVDRLLKRAIRNGTYEKYREMKRTAAAFFAQSKAPR